MNLTKKLCAGIILILFSLSIQAQPEGSGTATALLVDIDLASLDLLQIGPTAGTMLSGVSTTQSDDDLLLNVGVTGNANIVALLLDVNINEALAGDNVASDSTSFNAATQTITSSSTLDDGNVTISLDVLGLGTVPIVDIAGVFTSDAEVAGPCGASGGNTLNPAASSNIVSAGVSVLGQSIGVSDGSALQNFNVGTEVSALADVLGIVGSSVDVTGTLTLNATNTSAAAGMGSADATSLLLDIDVNFDLLGAIGSDVLNILVEISASDTDMDCMSSPVELQQFEVL